MGCPDQQYRFQAHLSYCGNVSGARPGGYIIHLDPGNQPDEFPWGQEEYIEKIWEEYRRFHAGPKHEMASYKVLNERSGVQWPFVDGKETRWRFNPQHDPACTNGKDFDFYVFCCIFGCG